jgi:hypothetical protein
MVMTGVLAERRIRFMLAQDRDPRTGRSPSSTPRAA